MREALRDADMSQEVLANHLNMSQQAVSRRLLGEVEFSISELTATAELLRVPLGDLLPLPDAPTQVVVPSSPEADGTADARPDRKAG